MTPGEETLLSLVGTVLEVRQDGSIWRKAVGTRTGRWRAVEPRRVDKQRADGYSAVRFSIDGRERRAMAHRLIWMVFVGPIPVGKEPNHKNGRRSDNRLSNLELLTKGENLAHSYRELNRPRPSGERNGRAKLTRTQATQIRERVAAGEPRRALAREFGVSHTTVQKIERGICWRDEMPKVGA